MLYQTDPTARAKIAKERTKRRRQRSNERVAIAEATGRTGIGRFLGVGGYKRPPGKGRRDRRKGQTPVYTGPTSSGEQTEAPASLLSSPVAIGGIALAAALLLRGKG